MNSLLRKVIGSQVFKRIKEVMCMNNYKINDDITEKVAFSYDEAVKSEDVITVINRIRNLMTRMGFSSDVVNNLNNSFASKVSFNGKNIVVNNPDAFCNEEIDEFHLLDNKISGEIDAIQFEINSLVMQKQSALDNFNIAQAVKINDKINSLKIKLANKQSEISKYNNDISKIEQDFASSYEKMKEMIEGGHNKDFHDVEKEFGKELVDKYKVNLFYVELEKILQNLDKDSIKNLLDNDKFKSILGSYYQDVLKRFENVGADN